jgi:hypothetical protein
MFPLKQDVSQPNGGDDDSGRIDDRSARCQWGTRKVRTTNLELSPTDHSTVRNSNPRQCLMADDGADLLGRRERLAGLLAG